MKKVVSFIALGLMIIVLQSCGKRAIYDQVYDFGDKSWDKEDTAVFHVDIEDTIQQHNFLLSLRTTKEYLYSNLWVYIEITSPDGSVSKVAEKLPIANPDGSWIGKVSGTLVTNEIYFDSKVFPLKGKYIFKITNATQEASISDVLDVGLRIE